MKVLATLALSAGKRAEPREPGVVSSPRGLRSTQTLVEWKRALRVDELLERAAEDGPSSFRRLVRIATRV
jgi:hypothetical protein